MCVYVQNCCHLCPKSGLNMAKRWLFTSVIQGTNVIVDLKLLTTGTGKEIKPGLKLVPMETTYMQAPFKKKLNIGISVLFFCKFLRNKGLTQNVG